MIRLLSLGLLALLLPPMAHAACPGHVSTTGGIVLTRDEPFLSSLFRATDSGLSEARIIKRGGTAEEVSATYLHALAPQDRISARETITLQYGADLGGLQTLQIGESWTSDVVVAIDGQILATGSVTKTLVGTEEISFGDCRYLAWVVEDRLDLGLGDDDWFLQYYVPDLGLVVRSLKMSGAGEVIDGVVYNAIGIMD